MTVCRNDNDSQIGSQGDSYTPPFSHSDLFPRWKVQLFHQMIFSGKTFQINPVKYHLKPFTGEQQWVKRANGMHGYDESYIDLNSKIIIAVTRSDTTNEAATHPNEFIIIIPGSFLETLPPEKQLELLNKFVESCLKPTSGDIKVIDTFNVARPEIIYALAFVKNKRLKKGEPNLLPGVKGFNHGKYYLNTDNCQTVEFVKKGETLKSYDGVNLHGEDETHWELSLEGDKYREFISQLLRLYNSNKSVIAINRCAEFVLGTILGAIDFKVKQDKQWDRCPREPWWETFLNQVKTFKIVVSKKKENPITKKWNWVRASVERSLKALIANKAGIPLEQLNDPFNRHLWKQQWNQFGNEVFDRECSPQHEALAKYGLAAT